MSDVTITTQQ